MEIPSYSQHFRSAENALLYAETSAYNVLMYSLSWWYRSREISRSNKDIVSSVQLRLMELRIDNLTFPLTTLGKLNKDELVICLRSLYNLNLVDVAWGYKKLLFSDVTRDHFQVVYHLRAAIKLAEFISEILCVPFIKHLCTPLNMDVLERSLLSPSSRNDGTAQQDNLDDHGFPLPKVTKPEPVELAKVMTPRLTVSLETKLPGRGYAYEQAQMMLTEVINRQCGTWVPDPFDLKYGCYPILILEAFEGDWRNASNMIEAINSWFFNGPDFISIPEHFFGEDRDPFSDILQARQKIAVCYSPISKEMKVRILSDVMGENYILSVHENRVICVESERYSRR